MSQVQSVLHQGNTNVFSQVRISRYWSSERLTPAEVQQLRLEESIEAEIIPGNLTSLQNFFSDFGTHYISSYTTGDSLYQVFVYRKSIYKRIKDRLKTEGVTSITSAELSSYFSPWYADHTGKILSASSNPVVEDWAATRLKIPFYLFSFQSLIQLTNPTLLRSLDGLLGDEAVLQLELRSLAAAFADGKRRKWFREVLDNQLKLWDTNMCKECFSEVNGRIGCPPHRTNPEVRSYTPQVYSTSETSYRIIEG